MSKSKPFSYVKFLTDYIFAFVIILLSLRFILKLFGANTNAGFVSWIYETSQPLLSPFIGIFPTPHLEGAFIIEFSTLFAIIIYSLVNLLIAELIIFLQQQNRENK